MPVIAENKRGLRNYAITESWDVGIVLTGPEVKSAKAGSVDFAGSYVSVERGQLWLKNFTIAPYKYAGGAQREYNPKRRRKLLATRREIQQIAGKGDGKGLTLIPARVYTKQSLVKLSIALVRGTTKHDKRERIKKRELDRKILRAKRT